MRAIRQFEPKAWVEAYLCVWKLAAVDSARVAGLEKEL